jgi:phospholipase/carboxylesterase
MSLLDTIDIETGPSPRATVIVLHGLGADGNDFVPIAEELDLGAVGDVRFVFPHAPAIPVTINNGHPMRAWYDIVGFDRDHAEDETGLRRSRDQVEALLAREQERGMPADRIVLGGFSQGCAMALMTGLRHGQRLAGIAGLSGYLPLAGKTAQERTEVNAGTPIFLGHGRNDNVVDVERGEASRDALRALGYDVEWHDYPMTHSVSLEEIADLNRWLVQVLTPA